MLCVLGPGALGGLLAALLTEGGAEVALLAPTAGRAARLREGLHVSGPDERPLRVVEVAALGPEDAPDRPVEAVLLCVKARDTAAAVARAAALPGAPTLVVLQNGLGRAEEVARLLGDPDRVVAALTSQGATLEQDGRLRHAGHGPTRLGALTPAGKARAAAVARALAAAGLEAEVVDDPARLVWEKLQVNAAINALTGLLGCNNGRLLVAPSARALAGAAAAEVGAVARSLGVAGDWSAAAAGARWEAVARATADNASSTLQDLRRGRPTEVNAINGAVAAAAREAGVAAPVNELLARLVAAREELTAHGGGQGRAQE
ncbi:MAG: 2-dehydropantoate 2-reductase [Planctomycetes bacterium]|nr:2-dehydropantoate 2-reductase [Planctomycetota bacterium]